jgi:hypothetical protein
MQSSAEIRFRIDRHGLEQLQRVARQLGADVNKIVRVFIRRAIAEGGFWIDSARPFRSGPRSRGYCPLSTRWGRWPGSAWKTWSEISRRASHAAYEEHVKAGRLPASSTGDDSGVGRRGGGRAGAAGQGHRPQRSGQGTSIAALPADRRAGTRADTLVIREKPVRHPLRESCQHRFISVGAARRLDLRLVPSGGG